MYISELAEHFAREKNVTDPSDVGKVVMQAAVRVANRERYYHLYKRRRPYMKFAYDQFNAADMIIYTGKEMNRKDPFYTAFFTPWEKVAQARKNVAEIMKVSKQMCCKD